MRKGNSCWNCDQHARIAIPRCRRNRLMRAFAAMSAPSAHPALRASCKTSVPTAPAVSHRAPSVPQKIGREIISWARIPPARSCAIAQSTRQHMQRLPPRSGVCHRIIADDDSCRRRGRRVISCDCLKGRNKFWRRKRDSNPRAPFDANGFQDRRFQPLTHSSAVDFTALRARLSHGACRGGILAAAWIREQ